MVLAEDSGGGGGRSGNRGDVPGEEANSKAVVAAKTGNLAVSVKRNSPDDAALGTLTPRNSSQPFMTYQRVPKYNQHLILILIYKWCLYLET